MPRHLGDFGSAVPAAVPMECPAQHTRRECEPLRGALCLTIGLRRTAFSSAHLGTALPRHDPLWSRR